MRSILRELCNALHLYAGGSWNVVPVFRQDLTFPKGTEPGRKRNGTMMTMVIGHRRTVEKETNSSESFHLFGRANAAGQVVRQGSRREFQSNGSRSFVGPGSKLALIVRKVCPTESVCVCGPVCFVFTARFSSNDSHVLYRG